MEYKFKKGMYVKIHGGEFTGHEGIIMDIATVYEEPAYTVYVLGLDDEIRCDYFERELERSNKENFILDLGPLNEFDPDLYYDCATMPNGFDSMRIAIWPQEGQGYPHFHFYRGVGPKQGIPKAKKSGGGCICFKSANYFKHAGHQDTMKQKEIDDLIIYLNSKSPESYNLTIWQQMILEWNSNNGDVLRLPLDLPIPEYYASMPTIQGNTKKK